MNKRKRMAALKHRRRRARYEVQHKAAVAAGTVVGRPGGRRARPEPVAVPVQEPVAVAVAAPVPAVAEAAVPARRPRRVAQPTVTVEAAAPARRTRRAAAQQPEATPEPVATEAPVTAAPARRVRRAPAQPPETATAPASTAEEAATTPARQRPRRAPRGQREPATSQGDAETAPEAG
ncbi:MAG: hypothetical protein HY532_00455 [Chloroflexi bacterium]|nr:hypothetical protein [Chloroflexota bacterium]